MSVKTLTLNWGDMLPARLPVLLRPLVTRFSRLQKGTLDVHYAQDMMVRIKGRERGPKASIELHSPASLMRRLLWRGDLGFAESYMAGEWDSNNLSALLYLLSLNLPHLQGAEKRNPLVNLLTRLQHRNNRNTLSGSKRNIAAHYDLGNDFYARWLDESMTYSSAVFDQSADLAAAQQRKYDLLMDYLDPKPGQHILEIGCGWGGFAEYAARWGMRVTGITLSQEQLDYAQQRIERAGLSDRVTLQLCDYRELREQYDHIVSIEMFEAVGQEYWSTYFDTLSHCLKPKGRAALQVITIDESDFERYAANPGGFIQQYIFPGGMLPTATHLRQLSFAAGLETVAQHRFGPDYADTLENWLVNFETEVDWLESHGYDERFRRMWRYYLAFCEAGFRDGRIDVVHHLLEKP